MTVHGLLAELQRLGIRLAVEGDRLRFAPRHAVTPRLSEELKAHKRGLIQLIENRSTDSAIQESLAGTRRHLFGELIERLNRLCPLNWNPDASVWTQLDRVAMRLFETKEIHPLQARIDEYEAIAMRSFSEFIGAQCP